MQLIYSPGASGSWIAAPDDAGGGIPSPVHYGTGVSKCSETRARKGVQQRTTPGGLHPCIQIPCPAAPPPEIPRPWAPLPASPCQQRWAQVLVPGSVLPTGGRVRSGSAGARAPHSVPFYPGCAVLQRLPVLRVQTARASAGLSPPPRPCALSLSPGLQRLHPQRGRTQSEAPPLRTAAEWRGGGRGLPSNLPLALLEGCEPCGFLEPAEPPVPAPQPRPWFGVQFRVFSGLDMSRPRFCR